MIFYKRFPGDYKADTGRLRQNEHGAYTLLLDEFYSTEKPLPIDRVYDISLANTKQERDATDYVLQNFWEKTGEGWINPRAIREIETSKTRRESGRRGGKSTQAKHQAKFKQTGKQNTEQTSTTRARARIHSQKPETQDQKPLSSVSSDDDKVLIDSAFEIWHRIAAEFQLPMVAKQSSARKKKLLKILKNHGGLEAWAFACGKIRASAHLQGRNDRGWRANFDFMTQESSFIKVTEGVYDGNGRPKEPGKQAQRYRSANEIFEEWGMK